MRNQEICQLSEERTRLELMSLQASAEVLTSREYANQNIQKLESRNKDLQIRLDHAEIQNQQLLSHQELLELKYVSENQQLKKHFESLTYQLSAAKSQLSINESENEQLNLIINVKDDHIQRLQEALDEQKTINCDNGKY